MARRIHRVGIVGLQPGRSWSARAHVPALRALADRFAIAGVANSSLASAEAAAAAHGLPRAFADVAELTASPDVDVVAVTVRVPHHAEIVKLAIANGKHVFCEWPLGNGLAEAEELARLARERRVLGVAGTQARVAPEIEHLRALIAEGFVGDILSTTLVGNGMAWGPQVDRTNAYLIDARNGATLLTIPLGHTLAALRDVLGEFASVSATLATRRTSVLVVDAGESRPMTAPDQVVVDGLLASGAPIGIHYRGGTNRGTGLSWEINGTEGDIRISAAGGHAQMLPLSIEGARGDDREMQPIAVPAALREGWPDDPVPGNVARIYRRMADDLDDGTMTAPSFDDAVGLHRVIDAIERAAATGSRTSITAS